MNLGNQLPGELMRMNAESLRFKYFRISSKEIFSPDTPYNFTFNCGNDSTVDRCMFIQPISCIFPNLANNISTAIGNSTFNLICNGVVRTTVIPDGYYSVSNLTSLIQTNINTIVGVGYLTITTVNNRLTWTASGGGTLALTFLNNPMASTLGFNSDILASPSFTSPDVPSLTGMSVLYIHSQTMANNVTYLNTNTNNVTDVNGFITVGVNTAYGGQQITTFNETQKIVLGCAGMPVRQLRITLRTNGGRLYTELSKNQEFIFVVKLFLM